VPATAAPTTAERRIGTESPIRNRLATTSMLKMAPPMGALKVPATPAATPQTVRSLRSLEPRRKTWPTREPKEAPIWAIGPSRPALPPLPMITAEARIKRNPTRFRIWPPPTWRLSMIWGTPCPFASGARRQTIGPTMSPPIIG